MVTKLVGRRIAQLRNERGLSQLALSSQIGMARTYYAEVETGKRNVSMRNLERITRGLGITLAEFFDSDVFDPLYKPGQIDSENDARHKINYAIGTLPPIDPASQES